MYLVWQMRGGCDLPSGLDIAGFLLMFQMLFLILYSLFGKFLRVYLTRAVILGGHLLAVLIFFLTYFGFLYFHPDMSVSNFVSNPISCSYRDPSYVGASIFLQIAVAFSILRMKVEKYLSPRDQKIKEIASEIGITDKLDLAKLKFFINNVLEFGGVIPSIKVMRKHWDVEIAKKQLKIVKNDQNREKIKKGIERFMEVKDSYSIIFREYK